MEDQDLKSVLGSLADGLTMEAVNQAYSLARACKYLGNTPKYIISRHIPRPDRATSAARLIECAKRILALEKEGVISFVPFDPLA